MLPAEVEVTHFYGTPSTVSSKITHSRQGPATHGKHTRLRERGWGGGGVPIPSRGQTLWYTRNIWLCVMLKFFLLSGKLWSWEDFPSLIRIHTAAYLTDDKKYFLTWCRYEEPVSDVSALQRMRNTPEYDRKASVPVKAAPKDASCSRFQASFHSPPETSVATDGSRSSVVDSEWFFFVRIRILIRILLFSWFWILHEFFSNIININLTFEFPSCVLDWILWRDISFLEFIYIKDFIFLNGAFCSESVKFYQLFATLKLREEDPNIFLII